MQYIIGLDISTAVVGITILDENKTLIFAHAIETDPEHGFWQKMDQIEQEITIMIKPFVGQIKAVYVEQDLQMFRPGLSSAATLTTLSKANGIVSYMVRNIAGVDPNSLNVNAARASVGLKIIRKTKLNPNPPPTKAQVVAWVHKKERMMPWQYKTMKSGSRKGQQVEKKCNEDIADSYVIALAGVVCSLDQKANS